ncbi:ABC transporter substrate-binding protein [Cohnella nanjingensis]|uniref:Carbohydrate ABC transporter substrate-binding protein n=1 Tax=Cohnella nanjingensis TaxID=1387779 RepID=A0A7X0RLQ8_9BACL|nr:ABC transporter substrate-binding protein [Cohnella nanjingensis]MBB6669785.1 carbohydrate ABC transporter substrate-binding protein [Cohnella nanjingensis]
MKKIGTLAASLALMTGVLAACGGNSNSNQASPSETSSGSSSASASNSPAADPVKFSIMHNQGEYSWPTYEKMVSAFNGQTGNTAELKYIPAEEAVNWLQTQFIGHSEPEIVSGTTTEKLIEAYKNGWIVDLLPYLDEISPYTNKPWKDSFLPGLIDSALDKTDANNPHLYGIPNQVVTVNLYYNKDIFAKIGVTDPPATITEFLEVAKKAKDAGYIPFSIQNSMDWNLGWLATDLASYLWRSSVSELDLNQSGKIELNEWAVAVVQDKVTKDSPQLKEYLRLLSDLVPYFNEGFNSASWEFEGLFNDGKSAMTLNGSWYPNQYQQGGFKFNYGIAPIPYLDKGYSELGGTERYKFKIGSTPYFAVTRNAKENKADSAAVNFLQYMTAPEGGAKLLAEELNLIPVVQGVDVPEVLKPIMESFGNDEQLSFGANEFTAEQKDKWFKNQQKYLAGKMTAEQFLNEFGKDLKKYANEAIKTHPEWNLEQYLQ